MRCLDDGGSDSHRLRVGMPSFAWRRWTPPMLTRRFGFRVVPVIESASFNNRDTIVSAQLWAGNNSPWRMHAPYGFHMLTSANYLKLSEYRFFVLGYDGTHDGTSTSTGAAVV